MAKPIKRIKFRTPFSLAQHTEMRRQIVESASDPNRFGIFLVEGIQNGAVSRQWLEALLPRISNAANREFAEKTLKGTRH